MNIGKSRDPFPPHHRSWKWLVLEVRTIQDAMLTDYSTGRTDEIPLLKQLEKYVFDDMEKYIADLDKIDIRWIRTDQVNIEDSRRRLNTDLYNLQYRTDHIK